MIAVVLRYIIGWVNAVNFQLVYKTWLVAYKFKVSIMEIEYIDPDKFETLSVYVSEGMALRNWEKISENRRD